MRTTLRLPDDLLHSAKKEAARQGRTLTSLVEEGLRVVLAPDKPSTPRKIDLPVSAARGGLRPGVDLNRSAELADVMDGR